ncbi:MAG TPA: sugar ABC transporter permease [Candidatus Limnocylindrales bacterium]|nr:sugar ABC transporter permease [Candidatus Limnocylindrales bacterium]
MTTISRARSALRRPKMTPLARREARQGLLFISPWLLGFVLFTVFPMLATLFFSVTNIQLNQEEPLRFVGFDNYSRFLDDKQAIGSLRVTLSFAVLWLPVSIVAPFLIALLLNSVHLVGRGVFRVLLFMPYVVPFVAGALIWNSMLGLNGWINEFMRMFGFDIDTPWLRDPSLVYPGLALVGVWGIGGAVIINLAGLRGIPTELYDAAKIDGAGGWAQLRHVTVPLMTPVIFYSLILGVVEVMQYFLVPLVLTNGTGEPGGTTLFYNLYLYKQFFTFQNMSYGATLAWVLFVITLAITLLVFWSARRWVYYAGER